MIVLGYVGDALTMRIDMLPAHSQATHAHHSANPLANVSSTHPSDGEAIVYAQVQPKARQVTLQDRALTRFGHDSAAVVAQNLVSLPGRYGLPEIAELKQLGMTQASVANATVLPSDGMPGASLVMAAPGEDISAPVATERLARFGAALLSTSVAHVVCANHSLTSAAARMPYGRQIELAAHGGPLEMTFSQGNKDGLAPEQFRVIADLPQHRHEDSGDIGVWNLNLGEATAQDVQTIFGSLYKQSEGQNVAFCCQSGNSRSGAAALLFHQRKTAEEAFKRGEAPRVADLVSAAKAWEKGCKAARSEHFGTKMPDGLLEGHAQALVTEISERLGVNKSKPLPPLKPKPVLAAAPGASQQPPQTAALAPRPTATSATSALDDRPKTPPKTPPKRARIPMPAPRTQKSVDTESVTSGFSDASWDAVSVASDNSSLDSYSRLRESPKSRATPTQSTAYNAKPGEGKPLGSVPQTATPEASPAAAQDDFPPEAIYSEAEFRPSALYAKPWGHMRPEDMVAQAAQAPARARFDPRASFRVLERSLQRASTNIYSEARPMNDYALASEIESEGPPVFRTLHAWQQGRHECSGELKTYLHTLAKTFSQDAKQGLNLFAAKKTYGVGRAINGVMTEAQNKLWKEVSGALAGTMNEADPTNERMAYDVLIAVLKNGLAEEFSGLDQTARRTWVRRSAKSEIDGAIKDLQMRCDKLKGDLERTKNPTSHEIDQVAAYNLTLMSFMALHAVGTDPTLKH